MTSRVKIGEFGTLPDGTVIRLFTLDSGAGCQVSLSEYGAAITSIIVPDRLGNPGEICLGYDDLESYLKDDQHIGVTVGRYANRIAGSNIRVSGQDFPLSRNDGDHHLHGGGRGFGKRAWTGTAFHSETGNGVKFQRISFDGEEGYPGDMDVAVVYTLTADNILSIDYEATCNADTYVSLTNHAYFNLSDDATIVDHYLTIDSHQVTPADAHMIVSGEHQSVENTAFDFRAHQQIGQRMKTAKVSGGFDINYVLDSDGKNGGQELHTAASVYDMKNGRILTIKTSQPCLQFYTGNNLGGIPARDGSRLQKFAAFCLEPQDYPNGPNIDSFPVYPLKAGMPYRQRIEFHFTMDGSDH